MRGRQQPCGPGTVGQREDRMVGRARGWPPVHRGQAGQGGAPASHGGVLGEQKWRTRVGQGAPEPDASPQPDLSRPESSQRRPSLAGEPRGPAECRRGFQNQRPLAQDLSQHLYVGTPPRAPIPGPRCTSVAGACEPRGPSQPRAGDACTVSQRGGGALVTHASTEAGHQASLPRKPHAHARPPKGGPGRGWGGPAGDKGRGRGRGPGPV